MNKEKLYKIKQDEISNATGNHVEEIGDFKRIGNEVYKMGRNVYTGEKTNWWHELTLLDGDTLQSYLDFLNDYRLEL